VAYFLNFRKRPTGGGVASSVDEIGIHLVTPSPLAVTDLTIAALEAAVLGKHVIFTAHGFNVDQKDAYAELGNWQTLLQLDDSYLFIGMAWPGDSSWLGPLCYPGEGRQAMQCGDLLADFIEAHCTGAIDLSFVSHSLGARFILQAIKSLDPSFTVRQVAIMAGAINDDCLTNEYADAAERIGKINLLCSKKDEVLELAFPPGNIFEGIIDKGNPYWSGALGRTGPVKQIVGKSTGPFLISDIWDFGHGNYVSFGPEITPRLAVAPTDPSYGAELPKLADATVAWKPSWTAAFVSSRFK
jgi:hypothetical protein